MLWGGNVDETTIFTNEMGTNNSAMVDEQKMERGSSLYQWTGNIACAAFCRRRSKSNGEYTKQCGRCQRTSDYTQFAFGCLHIKKFESSFASVEDLISIGTIGLIKAVNTFCPERNIKLATYASRCIENEILMYLRKSTQLKHEISIDDPLNVDWDGNELLLSDVLGSDPNLVNQNIEKQVERDLLMAAVSNLSQREKTIMQLRFGLNQETEHTQKEVADTLGISQSYISRLEKRIMERLKKDLERVG